MKESRFDVIDQHAPEKNGFWIRYAFVHQLVCVGVFCTAVTGELQEYCKY